MVRFQLLGSLEGSLEPGWRQLGDKSLGHGLVDLQAADQHAPLAAPITNRVARAIITGRRIATTVIDAQTAPAASTLRDSMQ